MRYQLRDYRISAGSMERFIDAWTAGVVPLRERFGFRFFEVWASPETGRFVWIIGHDDFEQADEAYYRSPERSALDPDPAQWIEQACEEFVTRVL